MDRKESSDYVTELLKQLEELKRKKAHKERKLMKLKSCSPVISIKDEKVNVSPVISCAAPDFSLVEVKVKGTNQGNKENPGISNSHFINEQIPSFSALECSDNDICTDSKKKFFSHDKISNSQLPETKSEHSKISIGIKQKINKSTESVSFHAENINDVTQKTDVEYLKNSKSQLHTSFGIENGHSITENNDVNIMKTSVNAKIIQTLQPFKKNLISKTESNLNNMHISSEINECFKWTDAELINYDLKISPLFCLNPSSNESQVNCDAFNFPKFSTPTDANIYNSDSKKTVNIMINKQENTTALCKTIDINKASNIPIINENIQFVENVEVKNNKFDTSCVNHILNNGLSSILDVYHDSPIKKQSSLKFEKFCNLNYDNCFVTDIPADISKKRKLESVDSAVFNSECTSKLCNSSDLHLENVELDNHSKKFAPDTVSLNKPISLCTLDDQTDMIDKVICDEFNFDNSLFLSSNPFSDSQNKILGGIAPSLQNNCNKIPSQIIQAVDELIDKVCNKSTSLDFMQIVATGSNFNNDSLTFDSEILLIPETEGLRPCFSKDTEEFLETSPLSQSFKHFQVTENLLNTSSQSRLTTPVVDSIVSALKSSYNHSENEHSDNLSCNRKEKLNESESYVTPKRKKRVGKKISNTASFRKPIAVDVLYKDRSKNEHADGVRCHQDENKLGELFTTTKQEKEIGNDLLDASSFYDTLAMDTSFLEDCTQDLGKLKQVSYMSEENVQKNCSTVECETKIKSNLAFICSLYGATNEPVIDAEIILFNDVKYAFLQHQTQIHVWQQEKEKWVKIFYHVVEDKLFLDKICISRDSDNLVIVMLLSNDQKCCLQFLLFEKDAKVIKLMENTHWLEERHSRDLVLLCGLDGLMFATAHCGDSYEVSLHAFISLKENPRLMTAVLGSTDSMLCSLCSIDRLPNALMGINDSMLYIWHILEARLVTAVSLHPHDYLPIKNCFWATVEKGLIYFMTTCKDVEDFQVCQLIAANLATGFCQRVMSYTTLPSQSNSKTIKITKASYLEPFLVVAHQQGAYLWSVREEFCCAALSSKCRVTTIAISKDIENWGILAVGNNSGCINCYNLN